MSDAAKAAVDETWHGPVADTVDTRQVLGSRIAFRGHKWDIRVDRVDYGPTVAERDLLLHPGAVGVVALDEADRVLLIRQYRHPVGMSLFEPPAGLLDVAGEAAQVTAVRELVEEAGYTAGRWHTLIDFMNSPGGSTEALRLYLARDLAEVPGGRELTGEAEEAHLPRAWVDLDEARDLVLSGAIGNALSVIGILAAWAARARGWADLRPADAPWPARDHLVSNDRIFQRGSLG
jgi:ADP-ribose pyrophosphatase